MRERSAEFYVSMLWVIGCIAVLAMGALMGVLITNVQADGTLHDTYYIVGHFRYMLSVAMVFCFFSGWYFLFPKITGFAYSNLLGKIHFWLLLIGVIIIVAPQIVLF